MLCLFTCERHIGQKERHADECEQATAALKKVRGEAVCQPLAEQPRRIQLDAGLVVADAR